ncbi:MAG: glycosyltransferase family 2 protein [Candidatus ainarchaeum sp.]|nr:glycosyltransferase family 2 protein [Candidatus ainarchaeum sp.]
MSVVIANCNGKSMLRPCLSALAKHGKGVEVIVVDNGSSDGSRQMVEDLFPGVVLEKNRENMGFAKASNQGIRRASGEFVVLMNNDVEVGPGWQAGLLDAARQGKAGIAGGKLLFPDGRIQHAGCMVRPWGIERIGYGERDDGRFDARREVDYVTGALMLVKREVIEKIGLLDEEFSPAYYEETDYCWRARKAGFRVVYAPETVAIHGESGTSAGLGGRFYLREKNRVRFMLKNYPVGWLLAAAPFEFARFLASFPLLRTGSFLRAYCHNFSRLPGILEARQTA